MEVFQCLNFGSTWGPENTACGIFLSGFCKIGVSFITLLSMSNAYSHRFAVTTFSHLMLVWISIVWVSSCNYLMLLSTILFWWCAFTPEKIIPWPPLCQASTHCLALKIPLSVWYELMVTHLSLAYLYPASFPSRSSSANAIFWGYRSLENDW